MAVNHRGPDRRRRPWCWRGTGLGAHCQRPATNNVGASQAYRTPRAGAKTQSWQMMTRDHAGAEATAPTRKACDAWAHCGASRGRRGCSLLAKAPLDPHHQGPSLLTVGHPYPGRNIKNEDPTAEELDSSALEIEKVIGGGKDGTVRLRRLIPAATPSWVNTAPTPHRVSSLPNRVHCLRSVLNAH
jgi:hypothetical protein